MKPEHLRDGTTSRKKLGLPLEVYAILGPRDQEVLVTLVNGRFREEHFNCNPRHQSLLQTVMVQIPGEKSSRPISIDRLTQWASDRPAPVVVVEPPKPPPPVTQPQGGRCPHCKGLRRHPPECPGRKKPKGVLNVRS
jgi:hypothetical protein